MTLDSPTTGHVYTPTYDVRGMLGSLLLSLVSVHVGLCIAQRDKYFGASKQQRVGEGHQAQQGTCLLRQQPVDFLSP